MVEDTLRQQLALLVNAQSTPRFLRSTSRHPSKEQHMTDLHTAAKLALEALEYIDLCDNDRDFLSPHECFQLDEAITAIKQALNDATHLAAQPAERTALKPLTDEEMKIQVEDELVNYWNGEYADTTGAEDCLTDFARAIEAAHGIKENIWPLNS
jgi:hypothetical protein